MNNHPQKLCCEKCIRRNSDGEIYRFCYDAGCSCHKEEKKCDHEIESNMTMAYCRKCHILLPPELPKDKEKNVTHVAKEFVHKFDKSMKDLAEYDKAQAPLKVLSREESQKLLDRTEGEVTNPPHPDTTEGWEVEFWDKEKQLNLSLDNENYEDLISFAKFYQNRNVQGVGVLANYTDII